jgi:hypothetical protein
MTQNSLPTPHEQRKVEYLLTRLAKIQPISAKPARSAQAKPAIKLTGTTNSQVFYST